LGVEKLVELDAKEAVEEAVKMYSNLPLNVVNDCRGLTVLADSMLSQLFHNLIDNTVKHGKKSTMARIYYKEVGEADLQLIYEDDGVGVPLDNKHLIFQKGFSTGKSTGLGLFLIKKMIDVYGWEIREEGEAGAKFVITIPKVNNKGQANYRIQTA
jgi:signal transduction histidine kinase